MRKIHIVVSLFLLTSSSVLLSSQVSAYSTHHSDTSSSIDIERKNRKLTQGGFLNRLLQESPGALPVIQSSPQKFLPLAELLQDLPKTPVTGAARIVNGKAAPLLDNWQNAMRLLRKKQLTEPNNFRSFTVGGIPVNPSEQIYSILTTMKEKEPLGYGDSTRKRYRMEFINQNSTEEGWKTFIEKLESQKLQDDLSNQLSLLPQISQPDIGSIDNKDLKKIFEIMVGSSDDCKVILNCGIILERLLGSQLEYTLLGNQIKEKLENLKGLSDNENKLAIQLLEELKFALTGNQKFLKFVNSRNLNWHSRKIPNNFNLAVTPLK